MKYYSEETKKFYDTEKELIKAEEEKKATALSVSKQKKELSDAITLADETLEKAIADYNKIKEEAYQKYLETLKPAKEAVDKAQKDKYEALSAFNDKFGTYMVSYTGDKALKEFERTSQLFNNIFNRFFF